MMDSRPHPVRYPVSTIGRAVAAALREPAEARVEAVFESTFYVKFGARLICLGRVDMEAGPINCVTSATESVDWRACGFKPHASATVSSDMIDVGGTFRFPLSGSNRWSPEFGVQPIVTADMARGVAAFRRAAAKLDDIDGLGRFLVPGYQPEPRHYVCRAADTLLVEAGHWLAKAFRTPDGKPETGLGWVQGLSGLGPGLTPSGDDFLGGKMIALHALGQTDVCQALWRPVERVALENGNAISLAHLSAAADGLGSAPIHRALAAILNGDADAIENAIVGIAAIGHSSGWDIMTGVIFTLEGWLTARTETERI